MSELPDLPADLVVRPATPDDAEALAHLHLDVWDDAYTGLVPQQLLDDRRDRVAERVERWRELLTDGDATTLLATASDELVGFASAGPGRDNDVALAADVALELRALYVRASWWGRGIGSVLFREALGDRAAYLWVLAGNERATSFYERRGFRLDGTQDELDEGLHVRMVRAGTP